MKFFHEKYIQNGLQTKWILKFTIGSNLKNTKGHFFQPQKF